LAGLLIAGVGIAFCFLADAFSYLAVLFMLTRIRGTEGARPATGERVRIRDGYRYVLNSPLIFTTLVMMAVIGTFAYEFAVSLPLLARQTFMGDASVYAALTSAFGSGSAIGGIFAASR